MEVQSVNPSGPERNVTNLDAGDTSVGSGVTSFDDMEAIDKGVKETKRSEIKETKQLEKEVEGEAPKARKADKVAPEAETKTETPLQEAIRTLKLRNGEQDLDLRLDSLVPVKIEGKLEQVPLQELLNNYSGKTAWDKKFTEVDKIRKQVSQDLLTVRQAETEIAEIHKLSADGNPKEAIFRLSELMGANPIETLHTLRKQFLQDLGLEDVIPDEYQAKLVEEERDYFRSKLERESQKYSQESSIRQTEQKMNQVMEKFGMTDQQFADTYYQMKEKDKTRSLEPEDVALEYVNSQADKYLTGVIDDVNPELTAGEKTDALKHLKYFVENTKDVNHDDVLELANSVYGSAHAKRVSKKINDTKPIKTRNDNRDPNNGPLFFDEL